MKNSVQQIQIYRRSYNAFVLALMLLVLYPRGLIFLFFFNCCHIQYMHVCKYNKMCKYVISAPLESRKAMTDFFCHMIDFFLCHLYVCMHA